MRRVWAAIMMVMVISGAAMADVASSGTHYSNAIKRYIKRDQVFSFETFSANIMWGTLYLTPEARETIWARESWITEKSAEVHSVILPASKIRGTQFVVGLYAPKGTEAFDLTPETFWTLKLDQGGNEYTPDAIDPLPNDALAKRLIPFTNYWTKLYLVTFAGEFQKPFDLRMVGATGKGKIAWR